MDRKSRWHRIALSVLLVLFLTACAHEGTRGEQSFSADFSPDATEESHDAAGEESSSEIRQDAAAERSNKEIPAACAGATVRQTVELSGGGTIWIDARVDADGIGRVSRYRYIPLPFTEESRQALFRERFPAENWDVNEAAQYNEEEAAWEFITPRGESWSYQVVASETADGQIMNLERVDERLDYGGERKRTLVEMGDGLTEDVLLMEATGCISREIEQIGQETIEALGGARTYFCDSIHVCEEGGGRMYARAVFKQVLDGMPVTAWHDFTTVTTESSSFPVREYGSLFSAEELGLDRPVLTPEEAVGALQGQSDSVRTEEELHITKISLEYLTVISSEGLPEIVPVWRFWPEEGESDRMWGQILAVDAVTGQVIWENREASR